MRAQDPTQRYRCSTWTDFVDEMILNLETKVVEDADWPGEDSGERIVCVLRMYCEMAGDTVVCVVVC